MTASTDTMLLEIRAPFAVITFNTPAKKNAMDTILYKRLSALLQQVDKMEEVKITVLTGNGDFFSAGADVKAARASFDDPEARINSLKRLTEGNMDLGRAFYQHSKVLVAALNGPAIGLSAGLLGHVDLIYCVESAYLLTPFSAISLVCEGGASETFPRRMGLAKANEALLMGKKLSSRELEQCGFVNKVFPNQTDGKFGETVIKYLEEQFAGKDLEAVLISKQLIKATYSNSDLANIREVFEGAERFATGKPQAVFAKLAAKTIRHKL
ncbi:enoyl-CoA hydratase/isomerase family protein [Sporobolomyces salmoneus]|uniref:enoyl-CoA hydratase/isomerase family protein n=1 Tax=Sporobolomyces salmoneus TaxID=183962 RepID=UPI003180C06D